jgi:hypothetical protein
MQNRGIPHSSRAGSCNGPLTKSVNLPISRAFGKSLGGPSSCGINALGIDLCPDSERLAQKKGFGTAGCPAFHSEVSDFVFG